MAISVPLERNIAYTQTLVTGQGFMRSAVSFLIEGHGSYRQSPLGTKTVAVSFLVLLIELTQLTLFPSYTLVNPFLTTSQCPLRLAPTRTSTPRAFKEANTLSAWRLLTPSCSAA